MVAASRPNAQPQPAVPAADAEVAARPRPYWIPPGIALDDWPLELRKAVVGIVNPAYKELVMQAKPGLPQSTDLTVVYLLWLEILDQIELGGQTLDGSPSEHDRTLRATAISRHLRTVHAKLKASELLHRLDEFKLQWRRGPLPKGPLGADL